MDQELLLSLSKDEEGLTSNLDTMTKTQIIGYSVGHFQNDLCAACWFNYLLYFMKNVIFRDNPDSGFYAGLVFLSGQIADGIATPLVGYLSDRTETKIGKRTPWYIGGTIAVTICFFFIFQDCLVCKWFDTQQTIVMIIYYCFFPAVFNVGWASVQVAHLSLVPSLSLSRKRRDLLINLRNTFTNTANLLVLILAFLMFLLLKSGTSQFKVLALISLGLGFLTSIFFLITVREKKLTEDCKKLSKNLKQTKINYFMTSISAVVVSPRVTDSNFELIRNPSFGKGQSPEKKSSFSTSRDIDLVQNEEEKESISEEPMKEEGSDRSSVDNIDWKHWFLIKDFYIYGIVYMGARVLVNIQSSLIIFYLQNVLGISRGIEVYNRGLSIDFAIIPMLVYLSSTITSGGLEFIFLKFGRRKTFYIGGFTAVLGALFLMLLNETARVWMYPVAILIGFGQSICLNTAVALIVEVVGTKGSQGAFVFGAYSSLEKCVNGVLIYAIVVTLLLENFEDISNPLTSSYLKFCVGIIPALAVLVASILVAIGKAADYDSGDIVMSKKTVDTKDDLKL